jgi:hypothetical protein
MAQLIKLDGTTSQIKGEKPNGELTLEQMQKAVGGFIELVYLPDKKIMVVDEEGLLKEKEINQIASSIAHGVIVGDVLIISEKEIS